MTKIPIFNETELVLLMRTMCMYLVNGHWKSLNTKEKQTYDDIETKLHDYFDPDYIDGKHWKDHLPK